MAPATAGAVLFRSRPPAASPLPDRAQEGQLTAPSHLWIVAALSVFTLWSSLDGLAVLLSPPPTT
jgi:hypothetical protein